MSPGKQKAKVAIVDGDPSAFPTLNSHLGEEFEVMRASEASEALRLMEEHGLDVLLLGLDSSAGGAKECINLLREIQEKEIDTAIIVLSDDDKKSTALKVMAAGAYDFLLKPVDPDILRVILNRAVEKLQIHRENRILRDEFDRKDALGDLLGQSDVMRSLFESLQRVASSAATVSVRGESGTGKELVARALHDLSQRRDRPFISVNCAALPETLMEAELFGYEKGAFTGAVGLKEGRIELAHRGTLFLDEIGTLSMALQSKLLRVLDEHALVRLGGKKSIKLDFRLITATNEDLEKAVKEGRFREDLYYRIHVVPMFVPPLRDRRDDIPLLVNYFISVYCTANHLPAKKIEDEALQVMKHYRWPGNVRELENVVQRIVLMTDGEVIGLRHLPPDLTGSGEDSHGAKGFRIPAGGVNFEEEVAGCERRWLEAALAQSKGVKVEAAQLLGLNKDRMKYLCRKYKF